MTIIGRTWHVQEFNNWWTIFIGARKNSTCHKNEQFWTISIKYNDFYIYISIICPKYPFTSNISSLSIVRFCASKKDKNAYRPPLFSWSSTHMTSTTKTDTTNSLFQPYFGTNSGTRPSRGRARLTWFTEWGWQLLPSDQRSLKTDIFSLDVISKCRPSYISFRSFSTGKVTGLLPYQFTTNCDDSVLNNLDSICCEQSDLLLIYDVVWHAQKCTCIWLSVIKASSSFCSPATVVLKAFAIMFRSTETNGWVYWMRALLRIWVELPIRTDFQSQCVRSIFGCLPTGKHTIACSTCPNL